MTIVVRTLEAVSVFSRRVGNTFDRPQRSSNVWSKLSNHFFAISMNVKYPVKLKFTQFSKKLMCSIPNIYFKIVCMFKSWHIAYNFYYWMRRWFDLRREKNFQPVCGIRCQPIMTNFASYRLMARFWSRIPATVGASVSWPVTTDWMSFYGQLDVKSELAGSAVASGFSKI